MEPVNNFIILKTLPKEEKTRSGIIIPGGAEEDTMIEIGVVVESGCDGIKKGDQILFSRFLPMNFKRDGQELWALKADDVIAIL